jgi:hypothetical protein
MGNQQSAPPQCQPGCSPTSPISQAIQAVSPRQPPVTPDPVSACQATKIAANSLQSQLGEINNAVDSCDPSIPIARRRALIEKENRDFADGSQTRATALRNIIVEKFTSGTELAEAVAELKQYEKKLKYELDNAEKGSLKLEHDERKYRRDFLDNQPTDGVPWHIFGLQTSDDKVMLTFWITALISFSLLAHVVLTTLSPNETLKTRAIKGTISVVVALIVSYLLITYTG